MARSGRRRPSNMAIGAFAVLAIIGIAAFAIAPTRQQSFDGRRAGLSGRTSGFAAHVNGQREQAGTLA